MAVELRILWWNKFKQHPNGYRNPIRPIPICCCNLEFGPALAVQGHRHLALLLTPEFRNGSLDLSELLWLGCHRPSMSSTRTPGTPMTPVCIETVFCLSNSLNQLANHIASCLNPMKFHVFFSPCSIQELHKTYIGALLQSHRSPKSRHAFEQCAPSTVPSASAAFGSLFLRDVITASHKYIRVSYGFLKWGYPKIIHLSGIFIFPYKSSILWYLHFWKPLK